MKKYIIQYDDYDNILGLLGYGIPHSNLKNVSTIIVDLTDEEYEALIGAGINILKDSVGKFMFTPNALSNSQTPPNDIFNYYNIESAHAAGFDGDGVKVAIIDSGQHDNHHAAAPNTTRHDFTQGQSGEDIEITPHGGRGCIIVGQTNLFTGTPVPGATAEYGIAHDCDLHSMRVEEDSGLIFASSVISALNYCVSNNFDIINLSIALENNTMDNAILACLNAGIIVICASGNDYEVSMTYPANYDGVIAVNGWNDSVDPKVFGSYLIGPNKITITNYSQGHTTFVGGTSQAAFILTGILTIYKQKYPSLDTPKAIHLLRRKALQMDGFTYDIPCNTNNILLNNRTGAGFLAPIN